MNRQEKEQSQNSFAVCKKKKLSVTKFSYFFPSFFVVLYIFGGNFFLLNFRLKRWTLSLSSSLFGLNFSAFLDFFCTEIWIFFIQIYSFIFFFNICLTFDDLCWLFVTWESQLHNKLCNRIIYYYILHHFFFKSALFWLFTQKYQKFARKIWK